MGHGQYNSKVIPPSQRGTVHDRNWDQIISSHQHHQSTIEITITLRRASIHHRPEWRGESSTFQANNDACSSIITSAAPIRNRNCKHYHYIIMEYIVCYPVVTQSSLGSISPCNTCHPVNLLCSSVLPTEQYRPRQQFSMWPQDIFHPGFWWKSHHHGRVSK